METDILNFHHDFVGVGEYSLGYEDLLSDDFQQEQSDSLLDNLSSHFTTFTRNNSDDTNLLWGHDDEEREINGDIAVIPVSSQFDTDMPQFSCSPECKDDFITDWQHNFTVIESTDKDAKCVPEVECVSKSSLPNVTTNTQNTFASTSVTNQTSYDKDGAASKILDTQLPDFDDLFFVDDLIASDVVNNDISLELDISLDEEKLNFDLKEPFDLPSYIYAGETAECIKATIDIPEPIEEPNNKDLVARSEPVPIVSSPIKIPNSVTKDEEDEDDEDCCIDVETVSPDDHQQPVLQAKDVNSLLEQFEANEAVNKDIIKSQPNRAPPPTVIVSSSSSSIKISKETIKKDTSNQQRTLQKSASKTIGNKDRFRQQQPQKQQKVHVKQKTNTSIINRTVDLDKKIMPKKIKSNKLVYVENQIFYHHLDHDYCSTLEVRNNYKNRGVSCITRRNISNISIQNENYVIDENKSISKLTTTEKPQKQINRLNNSTKTQLLIKNNQNNFVKNSNGKIMVSVLKSKQNQQIVVETKTSTDQCVQNIIVDNNQSVASSSTNTAAAIKKKRKLNLEEYKKRRGRETKSCNNSPPSSPCGNTHRSLPTTAINSPTSASAKKMTPQEILLKMAADLLTATPKIKEKIIETAPETTVMVQKLPPPPPTPVNNDIEMLTIVSIGVNTDLSIPPLSSSNLKKILQNASGKIHKNSLISNILQQIETKPLFGKSKSLLKKHYNNVTPEHGEDKTVIVLNKNRLKPTTSTVETQTDLKYNKNGRQFTRAQYRSRCESSSASSSEESVLTNRSKRSRLQSSSTDSSSSSASISSSRSRSLSSSSYSSCSSSSSSRSSTSSSSQSRSRSRNSYSGSRNFINKYSAYSERRKRRKGNRRSSSNHSYDNRISNIPSTKRLRSSNDRRNSRNNWEKLDEEKLRQIEERRVIYVGRLLPGTTKNDLKRRFSKFGPIIETSIHFRGKRDNYGFVTFQYRTDAYEAIERGNEDPNLPQYDISFGGRRAFCQTTYSDLDNSEAIEMRYYEKMQEGEENSFDILLKQAQAKLRNRINSNNKKI